MRCYIYMREIEGEINLQIHLVMLGAVIWHMVGRWTARVALNLRLRSGSSLSLINTQIHFSLFAITWPNPLQQSFVGALASPPTYGRHVASAASWVEHSSLSLARSELPNPSKVITMVISRVLVACSMVWCVAFALDLYICMCW